MGLRGLLGTGLVVSLLSASLLCTSDAHAVGFASSDKAKPIEERVMLSRSSERSVLFTQLRFDSQGEDVLIIVPVADGSALDWSSRAFFEALDVATAPRVLGPVDNDTCPGHDEPAFDMTGDEEGLEALEPAEVTLFDDAASVQAFATDRGVTVSPALASALAAQSNVRFFVARFTAPRGISITKALRVVAPAPLVSLPLVLSEAGNDDLRVTAWAVGKGRALLGGDQVAIDVGELALEAGPATSNYEDLLFSVLTPSAAVPNPYLVDMASHESLRQDIALRENGPEVRSFTRSYFERAAAYAETEGQPSSCIAQAAAILDQSARVGSACPRSELGVIGGAAACAADVVEAGEVDPALLRCGPKADDLALILSDLEPDEAWLTRVTMKIPAAQSGISQNVSFTDGKRLDPELTASSIDLSECTEGGEGGGSSSNGPSSTGVGASGSGSGQPSSASGGTVEVPLYVYDGCSACADGSYELVEYIETDSADAPDAYYEGDDCAGDSSATYSDDSCDGDSYNGDEIDWDGEGCDCSDTSVDWDSEGCDCDSSGYSDTCSADGFGDGCDCGGESLCATAKRPAKHIKKPRRLNAFVYGALVFIVPLRRLSRRRSPPKKPSSCPTKQ